VHPGVVRTRVLYAGRFPEKVAAYIGSGQVGDWPAAESSSYALALAEAKRLNNRKARKKLRHRAATLRRADPLRGLTAHSMRGIALDGRSSLTGLRDRRVSLPRPARHDEACVPVECLP
jgi:hypothetical protein